MFRRLMVLLVSLAMVISMVPMVAAADNLVFSDMPDDWSRSALEKAVANGLITGYDGKILAKENLTRAQMAAIVNRSFGATVKASIQGFTDVDLNDWYYDDMAKAVQMKTFKGDAGKLNPDAPITREEAFAVIARAFKLGSSDAMPTGFVDLGEISSWAKGEVYSLINAGYIQGANGYIYPKNNITRAEFAQVMDNILKSYVKAAGEYTELPEGNVMINAAGVTIKGLTVSGDLIIGDGVGDGDVILDNVNVTGRMVVRGGGENSIIIKGSSTVGQVIVARLDGAVRVVVEEGAIVEVIYINDGINHVTIEGNIDKVVVQAPNALVVVPKGSNITNLIINKEAEGSTITVEGTVTNVVAETPNTVVEGPGTIGTGEAEVPPVVEKEPSSGGGSGGGGGGGSTTPDPVVVPLKLLSASLGGANVPISSNTLNVNFDLDEAPGEIKAVFNKAVEIVEIKVMDIAVETATINAIIGKSVPTGKSSTLTLTIDTPISQAHLDFYGDKVQVKVSTGSESETIVIILNGNIR